MTRPRIEAEPAYENLQLVARDLVARVGELLDDLPRPDGKISISWSLVATMAEANHRLAEVVRLLDGPNR